MRGHTKNWIRRCLGPSRNCALNDNSEAACETAWPLGRSKESAGKPPLQPTSAFAALAAALAAFALVLATLALATPGKGKPASFKSRMLKQAFRN